MQHPSDSPKSGAQGNGTSARAVSRQDRLKDALKANMARRKAQARARGSDTAPATGNRGKD